MTQIPTEFMIQAFNRETFDVKTTWASDLNFLQLQKDCVELNSISTPFITCWKIFQIYKEEDVSTLPFEQLKNNNKLNKLQNNQQNNKTKTNNKSLSIIVPESILEVNNKVFQFKSIFQALND